MGFTGGSASVGVQKLQDNIRRRGARLEEAKKMEALKQSARGLKDEVLAK